MEHNNSVVRAEKTIIPIPKASHVYPTLPHSKEVGVLCASPIKPKLK